MKSVRHLFLLLLLDSVTIHAQTINDKLIIHAGDSLSKHVSWLFPSFRDATVKFRDGRSVVYKMNFNLLLADMQFIGQRGDTMVITNPVDIDSIRLDSCSFIYNHHEGYFQILLAADRVSLAIHRRTTIQPVPIGGEGSNGSSGGVEMINAISNRQGAMPLVLNENMYVWENTSFVLYYKDEMSENAGKAAFLKLYNGDRKSFDQFVKTNKIDFNKQGDLEKLFHFCTSSKM